MKRAAGGDVEVLDDAYGLILGHQLAGDVFIFPLHHAGNAEEIDQHPEAETANREPVDQLHADAAEVEIVEAEEEPEEVGEERGFFADFIIAQHEGLRVWGEGLKNTLQGIWDGHGLSQSYQKLSSVFMAQLESSCGVIAHAGRSAGIL